MATIHPTAVVSRESEFGEGVQIGPYCTLEGRVRLGEGVRLIGHVYLYGPLEIGPGTIVYPFASMGFPAQDVKFKLGDPTAGAVVGRDCIIREAVTIHAASKVGNPTRVGDRVFMMVNAHVGHDASVGDGVVMVNNSALGGHAIVEERATLGGGVMIHQWGRVGRLAFLTGGVSFSTDVPPYCLAGGRNMVTGLNLIGMRRAGIPGHQITTLRAAFREAYRQGVTRPEMVEIFERAGQTCPPALDMARFIKTCKRSLASRGREWRSQMEGKPEAAEV
jgi:UDP-N-acetylglucosamine acyltransferase